MKKSILIISLIPYFANAFDLNDAWQAARMHSAQYSAAIHERNASFQVKEQARAQLLPQLHASANFNHQPESQPSRSRNHGWRVEMRQSLFDLSKKEQYEVGEVTNQLAETNFTEVDTKLLIQVAESYLAILSIRDKLSAVMAEKQAYQMQIKQAKALYRSGQATIIDTYEAQSGYDMAVAKETELTTQLITAENTLANMTGLNPEHIEMLSVNSLPNWLSEKTEEEWLQEAFINNPALLSYENRLAKSKAELRVVEGERYPSLDFTLAYQDRHIKSNNENLSASNWDRNKGVYVGLQLSVPIYTSGLTASRIRQGEETMQQQADLLQEEQRNIILQIRQTYAMLKGKQAQIIAQKRLLETNSTRLKSIQLGRDYGVRNNMDEVKARQDKASAEEQLAEAQYDYIKAYLSLLNVAGLLNGEKGKEVVLALFSR